MAALDWVFVAVLAVSFLIGAWRGLVYEVLSVMSWIAAFIVAQWLAPEAAGWLPVDRAPEAGRYAMGFIVVFIAVVFAGALLAWLIKKLVEAVGLRPVDRTLGAAFGLVRGAILLMAVAVVVNMSPARSAVWWTESKGAGVSLAALKGLKPVLPERFGQYLPG
ncbi:MAG: putative rane protein distantly related to colicin production protein [Nitrospira sp.]|jgi:membrane protein required for colicin V production|nr:putative rane protein distantly related to colicin production protein [Nitrospira sp.]